MNSANSMKEKKREKKGCFVTFFTFERREVLDINVRMRGCNFSHVDRIQHDRNHIVGKDFIELFCDVILAESILKREVELEFQDYHFSVVVIMAHLVGPVDHPHAFLFAVLTS